MPVLPCPPPLLPLCFSAVIPLYQTFSRVFPGSKPLLTYVMRNYKYWAHEASQK